MDAEWASNNGSEARRRSTSGSFTPDEREVFIDLYIDHCSKLLGHVAFMFTLQCEDAFIFGFYLCILLFKMTQK